MTTQAEIDKENDWQLAEWNRNATENTKPQPAPIPPAMRTAATTAIAKVVSQPNFYADTTNANQLADAALAAVGYGDLVAALEAFASVFEGNLENVGGGTLTSPSLKMQFFKDAKAALARVHGEADEGKR